MTVEKSLEYELTPLPLRLFSSKDQKMNKANKALFYKTSLKMLTDTHDLTNQACSSVVVDGGWLLYMVKWGQCHTWQEIPDSYLSYVQNLGRYAEKMCSMAIAACQKMITTSGERRTPAVMCKCVM